MKKNYNLTKLLKPYTKKKAWVALNKENTKVIASGRTIEDVVGELEKTGAENSSIIQAIPDYSGFVTTD